MSFWISLTVLAVIFGALNLFLVVGVIRRLRQHTELLSNRNKRESPKVMVVKGDRVDAFSATTVDGEVLDAEHLLGGPTLVGFFAQGCSSCEERRPDFAAYARSFPGGRERVLAVLVGDESELTAARGLLEPVARIVLQDRPQGAMTAAFRVTGYPAFAVFDADGTVHSSSTVVEDLPAPAATVSI